MTSRRQVIAGAAALLPLALARNVRGLTRFSRAPRVIVVGAGAFGGWTALELARRGATVTLIDAWGAGNTRASSGGETRVIRAAYNGERVYIEMARRSLDRWREAHSAWGTGGAGGRALLRETGALWLFESDDDTYARASVALMRDVRLTLEELAPDEAQRRYPQISFEGIRRVWWEREAGFLFARDACETVRQACVRLGVEYVTAQVRPGAIAAGRMTDVVLSDGTRRAGDELVFACGPWLGRIFPDVIGERIQATKQDVLYFGTPPGNPAFDASALPVWVNLGTRLMYGVPAHDRRGFKVADDTLGATVDPTSLERVLDQHSIANARALLTKRFPTLASAPLVHSEVCQYERTPDGHFLIDRHPQAANVLLLGGGSGHGFKMGPAIGEMAARVVLDGSPAPALFRWRQFPGAR